MTKAIEPNKLYRIDLDGCAVEGLAVGRLHGRAVFVPLGAPGDSAMVRITHIGQRKIIGKLEEVITPSDQRTEPVCPVFGKCGGCQLQHLKYSAQLQFKTQILKDALRSIAGFSDPGAIPMTPSCEQTGYRNRGQYPVARKNNRVVTGFFEARSHQVIPTERCLLHHEDMDHAVLAVRTWAGRKSVPVYDEHSHEGWLRHVVVRRSHGTGEVLVTIVGTGQRSHDIGDLTRTMRKKNPKVVGLVTNINRDRTNVVLGRKNQVIWGRGWIEEHLGPLRFRLSTGSFFQVNTLQALNLFDRVSEFCRSSNGTVVDAYCGVGAMALTLAMGGLKVIGIEISRQAILDARKACVDNSIKATFHQGRVEKVLPRLVDDGLKPSVVILDPPRKGCHRKVLESAARSGSERIAYISCNPGSLARDLALLFELGYEMEQLETFDMFPHTAHVETFAGLKKTR